MKKIFNSQIVFILIALLFAACEQKKDQERTAAKTQNGQKQNTEIIQDTALIKEMAKENNISEDSAKQVIKNLTALAETNKPIIPAEKAKLLAPKKVDATIKTEAKGMSTETITKLGAAMCNCMQPLEKELKPADIALMESVSAKFNMDMAKDTAAMKKFQKENSKEMMQFGFIFMRMQKYFKDGSETKMCMDKIDIEFGQKDAKPTSVEAALLADVLEKNGCKFLATMNRLASQKMQ
jgi:hypothetical protein